MSNSTQINDDNPQAVVDEVLGATTNTVKDEGVEKTESIDTSIKVGNDKQLETTQAVNDVRKSLKDRVNGNLNQEKPLALTTPPQLDNHEMMSQSKTSVLPRKKNKSKKVVGIVVGVIMLLIGLMWGGYYYYTKTVSPNQVASVGNVGSCWRKKSRKDCNGTCVQNGANGGKGEACKWLSAKSKCVNAGRACSGNTKDLPDEVGASNGVCEDSNNYAYCGGAINKCVSYVALQREGGGCNEYGENVYGIPTTYGANNKKGQCNQADLDKGYTSCSCTINGGNTVDYCFDRKGFCYEYNEGGNNYDSGADYQDGKINYGLCGLVVKNGEEINDNQTDYSYTCTNNGCTTNDKSCYVAKYSCKNGGADNNCTTNSSGYIAGSEKRGNGFSFDNQCGTTEQIDVACDGKYQMSRTRVNPPCGSEPPKSTTPSLTCTSLTKDVATPKIGDKLTFTCAGSVVPAGATTLSYDFRYRRNAGEWFDLSASGNTSSFTIALAGEYEVQCRACGTINNASVCDPNWVGATQ